MSEKDINQITYASSTVLFENNYLYNIRESKSKKSDLERVLNLLLGKNLKNILLLANKKEIFSGEHMIFLTKILAAINLKPDDVGMLNLADFQNISLTSIFDKIECEKVIAFGVLPANLGLNIEGQLNVPYAFNGKSILFTHDLGGLAENVGQKKQFWSALKSMFDV